MPNERVAVVNQVLPTHNQNGWLNAAAFSSPVGGTFGNCTRNDLKDRNRRTLIFRRSRDFRITESQALQFRTEMFNVPNHVELGTPQLLTSNSPESCPSRHVLISDCSIRFRSFSPFLPSGPGCSQELVSQGITPRCAPPTPSDQHGPRADVLVSDCCPEALWRNPPALPPSARCNISITSLSKTIASSRSESTPSKGSGRWRPQIGPFAATKRCT